MERLIFFSDAVFAIAITLLVLDIRLPAGSTDLSDSALLARLGNIWPKYLAYIISFLTIGLVWLGHHRKFSMIRGYDTRLMMLNLLLLMSVAFIPFPTSILSEYGNRTATIFYALAMAVVGLFHTLIWGYAATIGRLVDPRVTPRQIRLETLRALATPAVFLLSILLAFINDDLAKFSWLLLLPALLYLSGEKWPRIAGL